MSGGVSAASSLTSAAASVATAGAAGVGMAAKETGPASSAIGYFTDSMFRRDANAAAAASPQGDAGALPTAEAGRIFANALNGGTLAPEDTRYLGQLGVTHLAGPDCRRRVADADCAEPGG